MKIPGDEWPRAGASYLAVEIDFEILVEGTGAAGRYQNREREYQHFESAWLRPGCDYHGNQRGQHHDHADA
jgi:hypothetical protein